MTVTFGIIGAAVLSWLACFWGGLCVGVYLERRRRAGVKSGALSQGETVLSGLEQRKRAAEGAH